MKPAKAAKNVAWLKKAYEEGIIKKKPSELQEQDNPPELLPDLYWVWHAYCVLSERRQTGHNGPQPISLSDLKAYAEMTGYDTSDQYRQLLRFIPALDRVYLKDFYDKQNAELEKMRSKNKR